MRKLLTIFMFVFMLSTVSAIVWSGGGVSITNTFNSSYAEFAYNQTDTIFFYNHTRPLNYFSDLFVNITGDTMTGNLIVNTNITIGDRLFMDLNENHWIKNNASEVFSELAGSSFWLQHDASIAGGSIGFLASQQNKTLIATQVGRNSSASILGNSWMIIPNNLSEGHLDGGIVNMTELSNCGIVINELGVQPRIDCGTTATGADFFVQDDIQLGGTLYAESGLRSQGDADFIMEGNELDIINGSVHIFKPVEFTQGFNATDNVTVLSASFPGFLSPFENLQSDPGGWTVLSDANCENDQCATANGVSGGGGEIIIMETNYSSANVNDTILTFYYASANLVGSDNLTVTINNNTGSGEVFLAAFTGTNGVTFDEQVLGADYDNNSINSLRFYCYTTVAVRECFVDTVIVNGSGMLDTTSTVGGFDSEICFGDGTRGADGLCSQGIFYNASEGTGFLVGNWNVSGTAASGVSGSGTANTVTKWSAGTVLTNSQITDDGTTVGIDEASPIATAKLHVSGGDIAISNNEWYKLLNSSGLDDGTGFSRTTADATFLRFRANSFIYHAADDKDIRYWGADNVNNYNYKFVTGTNDWNQQQKAIDFRYRGTDNNNLFLIDADNQTVNVDGDLIVTGKVHYSGGSLGDSLQLFGEGERELSVERYYTNKLNFSESDFIVTGNYTGGANRNYIVEITSINDTDEYRGVGCQEDANGVEQCTHYKFSNDGGASFSTEKRTAPSVILDDGIIFGFRCETEGGCNLTVNDQFNFTTTGSPIVSFRVDTSNDQVISQVANFNMTNDAHVGDDLFVTDDVVVLGNLGINDTNPTKSLSVVGDIAMGSVGDDYSFTGFGDLTFRSPSTSNDIFAMQSSTGVSLFKLREGGSSEATFSIRNAADSVVFNLDTGANTDNYFNAGSVGFGTTTPVTDVEVHGHLNASWVNATGDVCITGGNCLSEMTGDPSYFTTNGTSVYNDTALKFGFGTDTPTHVVTVGDNPGYVLAGADLGIIGDASTWIDIDTEGTGQWGQLNFLDDGTVRWRLRKTNLDNFSLYSDQQGDTVMFWEGSSGNVCIGCTNPAQELQIEGVFPAVRLVDSTIGKDWQMGANTEAITFRDVSASLDALKLSNHTTVMPVGRVNISTPGSGVVILSMDSQGSATKDDWQLINTDSGGAPLFQLYDKDTGNVVFTANGDTKAFDLDGQLDMNSGTIVDSNTAYVTIADGLYASSGTSYIQNLLNARGGVADDGGDLVLSDDVQITGDLILTETAASQRYFPLGGDGANAAYDTGNEVCSSFGQSCDTVFGSDSGCAYDWCEYACTNDMAGVFIAMCYG